MMRIQASAFKAPAKELLVTANTFLREDIADALRRALEVESGNAAKALEALLENQSIARQKKIPVCQDTGYVSFFLKQGPQVCIEGDLEEILNKATAETYDEMPFRQSMVSDPVKRKPAADNLPIFIYKEQIKENKAVLSVIIKGAGSDNASSLKMFLASTPRKKINEWVVANVLEVGPKTCPPLVIGLGVGGNFERSALLSKKAFFRKVDERNKNDEYAKWEKELLIKINSLGIGPSAFGGKTSALDVFIEQSPVHMASLPVALNIGCYAVRTASMEVGVEQ